MRLYITLAQRALCLGWGAALAFGVSAGGAQEAPTAAKADAEVKSSGNLEVVTRGPLHEAFATRFQAQSNASITVAKMPPPMIDEVPPPVRPAGESVVWIPGYWAWDGEASEYLWISGTYRQAPPNQRWVPGYWNDVEGGYQWTSGFWAPAEAARLSYRSAPPKSLERGPTSDAPGDDYFYIPGCWEPRDEEYAWRPGYWAPCQANFVWTPACHVWTPSGYVFVAGYWDHGLLSRGMLFPPIRLAAGVQSAADVRFTPQMAIPLDALQFHLFAQADSRTYLFGNYYDNRYADIGIRPWYADQIVDGVPAPQFGYYQWLYGRSGANYLDVLTRWNAHFVKNVDLRPALTLTEQVALAGKLDGVKNAQASLLASSLTDFVAKAPANTLIELSADQLAKVTGTTDQLRLLGAERLKVEGGVGQLVQAGGEGNAKFDVATHALSLPKVVTPKLPAGAVPLEPRRLLESGAPRVVPQNVPAPRLPPVRLPGLPF